MSILFAIGNWLPKNPKVLEEWLKNLKTRVLAPDQPVQVPRSRHLQPVVPPLDPLIQEFKELVDNDATLHMQYTQMFSEVSTTEVGTPIVENYDQMFALVNYIMTTYTPPYSKDALVGFPINAILNWAMGTTNGYAGVSKRKSQRLLEESS